MVHSRFELAKQSKIKDGPVQEGPIKSSTDPGLTEKRRFQQTEAGANTSQMEEEESIANNGYLSPPNELSRKAISKKLSGPVTAEFNGQVIEICSGCGKPISDRYIMRVMDHSWHEACLQCAVCRIILTQTCYSRDCKLYCKADYEKLYGAKCTGCLESIPATEFVMRALDSIFHLGCFICVSCGKQLKKGDQYVIRSGKLFCRPDFEKEIALMQMSILASESATVSSNSQNSPISSSSNSNGNLQRQDGRRGPKRPRTILTTVQRRAFKASFEVSQKPCRKVRESLAKETGLSVRIVQVWFQNQRAKLKKIQRKQQLQAQHHQQQSGSDINASNVSGNLTDSSTDSPGYSVPPMQYLTHSPDGSYYSPQRDGFSRREVGMDSESSLQGLEDVLLQSGCSNGDTESCHHNLDTGPNSTLCSNPSMTPIDKLYSMQNSYFSSNEYECVNASN